MSQFHKRPMTECTNKEPTEKLLGFSGSIGPNTPRRYSKHAK